MKKRTKKYRPRHASIIGGLGVIDRKQQIAVLHQKLGPVQMTDLSLAFRLAFQNMIGGCANEEQWSTCVGSLNIAMVLAERGFGLEHEPLLVKALDGAFRARLRAERGKGWGFDGEVIQAIKEAYDVHEAQMDLATRADIIDAIAEVHRRMDEGIVYQEAA